MAHGTLTLDAVKASAKNQGRVFRASDFLTKEEQQELRESNARGKKIRKPYGAIDALEAEIIARFGWTTYKAWANFEIDNAQMLKWLAAERARDRAKILPLEVIITASVAGANHSHKGKAPKSLKNAIKVVKEEARRAQGDQI